jgi:hypothetical protein
MSGPLILVVGAIYLYIAGDLFCAGKMGLSLTFAGYAFSNIGLWMAAR